MEDDNNFREELINKILMTVYQGDSAKQKEMHNEELHYLKTDELDQKISDYYLYDIERKMNEKNENKK